MRTHAQKQSLAQKKDVSSASFVLDASSQSESLQRKADLANNAAQRAEAPRPNNTGMPDNLKSGIESLSGFSMDDVRVHYNSSKPATVQALAYTQGTDIHVAPGQEKHLPHEAWHVAQQMAGRVSPTTNINGMPVNDNAGLEHEADVMGEKAVTQSVGIKFNGLDKSSRSRFNAIQCYRLKEKFGGTAFETIEAILKSTIDINVQFLDDFNLFYVQRYLLYQKKLWKDKKLVEEEFDKISIIDCSTLEAVHEKINTVIQEQEKEPTGLTDVFSSFLCKANPNSHRDKIIDAVKPYLEKIETDNIIFKYQYIVSYVERYGRREYALGSRIEQFIEFLTKLLQNNSTISLGGILSMVTMFDGVICKINEKFEKVSKYAEADLNFDEKIDKDQIMQFMKKYGIMFKDVEKIEEAYAKTGGGLQQVEMNMKLLRKIMNLNKTELNFLLYLIHENHEDPIESILKEVLAECKKSLELNIGWSWRTALDSIIVLNFICNRATIYSDMRFVNDSDFTHQVAQDLFFAYAGPTDGAEEGVYSSLLTLDPPIRHQYDGYELDENREIENFHVYRTMDEKKFNERILGGHGGPIGMALKYGTEDIVTVDFHFEGKVGVGIPGTGEGGAANEWQFKTKSDTQMKLDSKDEKSKNMEERRIFSLYFGKPTPNTTRKTIVLMWMLNPVMRVIYPPEKKDIECGRYREWFVKNESETVHFHSLANIILDYIYFFGKNYSAFKTNIYNYALPFKQSDVDKALNSLAKEKDVEFVENESVSLTEKSKRSTPLGRL